MEKLGALIPSRMSSTPSGMNTSPARTKSEARVMARATPERIMELARKFSLSFRGDPDMSQEQAAIQARGIAEIFALYPEEVVLAVTDLARGLPSKQRFFPSLSEVKTACDEAIAPLHRAAARDIAQLETKLLLAIDAAGEEPEDRAATVARLWTNGLRDEMAGRGDLIRPRKPSEPAEEALARLSGLSVSDVIAKLNGVPDKDSASTPPRSAATPTTGPTNNEQLSPPRGRTMD